MRCRCPRAIGKRWTGSRGRRPRRTARSCGRGREASIPQAKIDEIVELTLHYLPERHTHWSCRVMAEQAGVSPATVQWIWDARGLKPHRADTFKLSKLTYGR